MSLEGTRVYVPDDRLVWVPATVVSVERDGKRFHVRVDSLRRTMMDAVDHIGPADDDVDHEQDVMYGDERVIDLRDDGMPDTLPLQNHAADMMTKPKKKPDAPLQTALEAVMGHAMLTATTTTGAEDMCDLHHLHEPAIVYNVRDRFFAQTPYTYTGKIVVAVNPYRWIKPLYTAELQDLYTQHPRDVLPPHVYTTSAEAFHNMKNRRIPQSILVSGESGAGKTETVKIMMEHLASISLRYANELKKRKKTPETLAPSSGHHSIVEKVLKSNPLLEAFGNAKTIRNDNSSRFGKFTQLQFSVDYCLIGAECRHYLLEKSRVIAQTKGERNYHIFYQLVAAQEAKYGFVNEDEEIAVAMQARDFRYLQDESMLLDGQTDLERYQITCDALSTIGVTQQEQDQLFRALCGILRLGQLEFVPLDSDKNDSSLPMASLSVAQATDDAQKRLIEQQQMEIETCASLLGVEVATLCQKLCSRTVRARQEVYSVPLSALQAGNNRDALAKELYARLFAYLVRRVNGSISGNAGNHKTPSYLHIDLLDIFGFESFQRNGFEQFCINFANEKLQQKFTMDVFKTVQEEYTKEQVGWQFIKYKDNQDMLDLLESSMGLMALLNEECVRPMGSDVSFASKILTLHESHRRLEKTRWSQTQFLLRHYAGPVTYDAEGFVEKNRDSLQSDLLDLLTKSRNALIAGVFGAAATSDTDADLAAALAAASATPSSSIEDAGGRRSSLMTRRTSTFMQETVSYKFKAQLTLLMADISATEVHYVRCIKPNSKKSPHSYEIDAVVNQLRCAGVIEAIRITRAAFPNKMSHETFLRRFVLLRHDWEDGETVSSSTAAAACDRLIQCLLGKDFKLPDDEEDPTKPAYVMGKTLVYFGRGVLEYLEQRRTVHVHDCAIKIQRAALRWMARKRMTTIRVGVVKLQAMLRRKVAQRSFWNARRKCVQIQSVWRGALSRTRAQCLHRSKMATRIQSTYRGFAARHRYVRYRGAVIKIQAQYKMRKQMGKYTFLLADKKEQAIMESEVALLKHRLEEEKRARLAIEAENSSLQQELLDVRQSSVNHADTVGLMMPPVPPQTADASRPRPRSEKDSFLFHEEAKLLDDSERMIDYLKKEVTKGRELIAALTQENENLKIENKKVKDAYSAAGASFAALNQHNKQQSKANLRLMSTHAALIKSQEEKMKKYQKQVADLKEDLKMQRSVYSAELMARVQQQDLLIEMVRLSESYDVPEELLDKMRSMIENSKPLYNSNGANSATSNSYQRASTSRGPSEYYGQDYGDSDNQQGRFNRSDTVGSVGPVLVSDSQDGRVHANPRTERRATIDSVMMNPPLQRNLVDNMHYSNGQDNGSYRDRQTWVGSSSGGPNRTSVYFEEESRHRKSRIGGMFKKMFKKDSDV